MRLYHYTNLQSLPRIMASGAILLTESNISLKRVHAGPPVVWFTTHPTPEAGHGLQVHPTLRELGDFDQIDKSRVRITVDLPKSRVTKFVNWAKGQGISADHLAALASQGGLYSWWISTQVVPMDQWVEVHDLQDTTKAKEGRLLWFRKGAKQHTQKDFRNLLEQHGKPVPKSVEIKRIKTGKK